MKAKFSPERNSARDVPLEIGAEDEWLEGLSKEDRKLISSIAEAGNNREWFAVRRAWHASSKSAVPLFNTAMAAALKCGQFKEGLNIFDKLSVSSVRKTLKSYCCAIRLCGERLQNRTWDLWMEAQQDQLWESNESACSLMCAALYSASKAGNVTFAATLLDSMRRRGKVLNRIDWHQGIDACRIAGEAKAPLYLFEQMMATGIEPNVISFSLLAGASGKNLTQISEVNKWFEESNVETDPSFFEQLVRAILGAGRLKVDRFIFEKDARAIAVGASPRRKLAAWRVIQQAKSKEIQLGVLLQAFEAALLKDPDLQTAAEWSDPT